MGGTIMKLIDLTIQKLYGCYNYNVTFNTDVTFIYGANGCGKTTILNITEAIITGQLFKLFDYKFTKIQLAYALSSNLNDIKYIQIVYHREGLSVKFDGNDYEFNKVDVTEEKRLPEKSSREIYRCYFNQYDFLDKIKRTFNYVYLPLNRSSMLYNYDDEYLMLRRYRNRVSLDAYPYASPETKDIAMVQIEALINYHCSRINSIIAKLSDTFRNDILKSLLEVNRNYDKEKLIKDIIMQRNTVSSLQNTKTAYIKMLKELELISKTEEENYRKFFADFIKEITDYKINNSKGFTLDFFLKFQEISKIESLIALAEKMEQRKSSARKSIDIFLQTMNDFVGNGEDGKKIIIDDSMGSVYFTTKYSKNPISIQHLSSGEKQLITFFANLIFNVKRSTSGIFVVDEPELSLHLSWQKIFTEKTLDINKNIQLVFATHSPEIIGKNRSKMFKLEKKYVGEGNKANE